MDSRFGRNSSFARAYGLVMWSYTCLCGQRIVEVEATKEYIFSSIG